MESSPFVLFLDQFKSASGEGAVLELKMRLLADKVPALQTFTHAKKLEDVELRITEHFSEILSIEEIGTLALCRKLRNKIMHCNFSVARETLINLGAEPHSASVRKIDLDKPNPSKMRERIECAITNQEGSFEYVAATATTKPGSVFGWLVEVGESGDLLIAAEEFRRAVAIIDQLARVSSRGA